LPRVPYRYFGVEYLFVRKVVLVLSAAVLVLVLERGVMAEHAFDHERLDVYRLSIEYVGFSFGIAKTLGGISRQARDQWLRAAQSIPLNIAEENGKQSLKEETDCFRDCPRIVAGMRRNPRCAAGLRCNGG